MSRSSDVIVCRCSVPEGRGSLVISPRRRREGGSPHATTGGSQSTGELTTKGEPPISHTRGRDPAGSLSPQYKSGHVGRDRQWIDGLASLLSRPPINRRPTNSVLRKPAIAQTRPSGQRGRLHRQPSGPNGHARVSCHTAMPSCPCDCSPEGGESREACDDACRLQ